MRAIVIIVILIPLGCLGQQTGEGGLVYINFKSGFVGISEEDSYFHLSKNPNPLNIEHPQVEGISNDFYVSFIKTTNQIFVSAESGEIAIALRKDKSGKEIAENKNEKKNEAEPLVLITESPGKKEPEETVKIPEQKNDNSKAVAKTETEEKKKETDKLTEAITDKNIVNQSELDEQKSEVNQVVKSKTEPIKNEVVRNDPAINQNVAGKPEPLVKNEPKLPKYHAIIIGISNYKHAGTGLGNLERPNFDAAALSETLNKYYHFEKDNIHLLKDATRADIIDELESLGAVMTEKDNLIVFYAGHGYWDENLQIGYWLPSDAIPTKKSSWIANSTIKDYIGGIKTKHTLLISDACFSGSIFKVREVETLNDLGMSKLYQLPSRKAMTSGNMKTVPDKSKFFEYFNKRLIENEDHYLSARQLFQNFYVAVINNTNTVPQYGVIQETGDEGGEFIFIRRE